MAFPGRKKQYTTSQKREAPQSKDAILQARVEPRLADKVKAFCFDEGISMSDFLRDAVKVGQTYAPYADLLVEEQEVIIPLLERLSKKF